jgi:hypothetical protein
MFARARRGCKRRCAAAAGTSWQALRPGGRVTDVFLSYSRCDRRFAERAAGVLERAGAACFLDVALLSPGSDWARAVDAALDHCSAVVLIASRESLASPSCAREWRRALGAGKPVIVAGIEQIAVPDELRGQPAVDLRCRAEVLDQRLVRAVNGEPVQAPWLGRMRPPPPMLVGGAVLALLIVFQTAALVDLAGRVWHASAATPGAVAVLAAHCGIAAGWQLHTVRWTWQFLRREKTALGFFRMTLVPLLWGLCSIFTLSGWLLPTGMIACAAMSLTAMLALKTLAWWLPSRAPLGRARPAFVLDTTGPAPPPVARGGAMRYEICYAPHDAAIAHQVTRALAVYGHLAAEPGSEPAARLLVLSSATSTAFEPLRELGNRQLPTICIVASTIALDAAPAAFHRFHWIDYRRHDREVLAALARWLDRPERRSEGLAAETLEAGRTVLPVGVGFLSGALAVASGMLLFGATAQAIQSAVLGSPAGPTALDPRYGLAAGLVAALAAAVLRARAVTTAAFLVLYAGAFALACAYLHAMYLELSILAGVPLASTLSRVDDWLLAFQLRWTRYATIAPQPTWRFVARQVVTVLLPATAAAVIVSSGDLLAHARW